MFAKETKKFKAKEGHMKRWMIVALALMLMVGLGTSWAQEERPYELRVSAGASVNNYEDQASRAAEFESRVDKNSTWYFSGEGRFSEKDLLARFYGTYIDGEDQNYGLKVDWARFFSLDSLYRRFYHRLDHDTLENLLAHSFAYSGGGNEAAPGGTAYVSHVDLSVGENFGITRSEWKNNIIFRIPNLPGVILGFNYRYETRKGYDQARTLSKCSGCHVVGMSRQIAEFTNEYVPYLEVRLGTRTFRYSFLYRNFGSSSDVPFNLYLNAEGPGNDMGAGVIHPNHPLGNRLPYDYSQGELPFARTPDSQKWMHDVKIKWEPVKSQVLNLGFVVSESENQDSDEGVGGHGPLYGDAGEELDEDYWALNGNWHWRISRAWSLTLRAKYYEIDGDEVTLHCKNSNGVPVYGPITSDDTPYDPNAFYSCRRVSPYDRDGFNVSLDLNWRYSRTLKFRFGYRLDYVDRDNADEYHVTDDTTEHTFKLGATWRALPNLRIKADYRFVYVDDPELHKGAAAPPPAYDPDPAHPNPDLVDLSRGIYDRSNPKATPPLWTESSMYEYLVYSRRSKDFSAQPEYVHDIKLKGDWMINRYADLALNVRYRYEENTETDGYDWEENFFMAGLNLNLTPWEKLGINAGYEFFYDEYTAMMCSSLYHG